MLDCGAARVKVNRSALSLFPVGVAADCLARTDKQTTMNTPSPSEIDSAVAEVLRGNRDAFRLIVRAYSLPLRSYLASQLHHLDDVDDLAQEVFLAAYGSLDTFRRGDDLGAWLRGIARNKLFRHFRNSARWQGAMGRFREQVTRAVAPELEQAVGGDQAETIECLLRCIGMLPEKLRRVVRAGLDGNKPSTLAEELETSVGAVYNLHYRANQLLRNCLDKELR
jgi:RNA polymerase sigma-70 factor, ECF subfamily